MEAREADLSDSELQKSKVKQVKTHKKGRLAKAQKNVKKEEPGVTTTELQQSGDKRRIELLFKAADPISPNELQVSQVVPQHRLPGNGGRTDREKMNKIHSIITLSARKQQGSVSNDA